MQTQTETNTEVIPSAPETKPVVPQGTKMSKRGFKSSADVEAEGIAKGEKPPTDPAAVTEEVLAGGEEMPQEFVFEDPNNPEPVVEPAAEEPEVAAEDGNYRIGDKTFKTQKEAWAYAEELDRQQLANDAFRQGLEAAQMSQNSNTQQVMQKSPEPEKIPDEFYTNPAAYHAKLKQEIINQATAETARQNDMRNRHESTMNKFWSDYPDLARTESTKKLAQRVLAEQYNSLRTIDTEKALKIVAEKSRAELRDLGVTTLPTKTLISNSKPAASPGSGQNVTRLKQDEKPLSFVQQFNNTKRAKRHTRA